MYNRICPKIFKEADEAIEEINKIKGFDSEARDFIEDFLSLNSDLCWVLIALAKAKVQDPNLFYIAVEYYKDIIEQDSIFNNSPIITEQIPMYYLFAYTCSETIKYFIDKVLDNFDEDLYHPYSVIVFINNMTTVGYDFITYSLKDCDNDYITVREIYNKYLHQHILKLSEDIYIKMMKFRLDVFKEIDTFSPTYKSMVESSMSMKEFKNKLAKIVTGGVLDSLDAASKVDEIIRSIGSDYNSDIKREPKYNNFIPDDIEDMFNE
jgi:hypothetical protein